MDLPRQDSSDFQGYQTSAAYESGYYPEDHLLQHFSFFHNPDLLEEDALNEKSCMQVLKIWMDKVDEDIAELEEDILMLQCQLLWDDDKWSKQCSVALREKIRHLDTSIVSKKKDEREDGLQSESEELPPRLHDLLKPLLETYLAKSELTEISLKNEGTESSLHEEQTEISLNDEKVEASTIKMLVPPAVELSNKKIEENASSIMLKTYERKTKSAELEERKISFPQLKNDTAIRNFDGSADACANDDLISKPSTLERIMLNLVDIKSELVDPMVEESSASMSIQKANQIESKTNMRNNDNEALSEAKVLQGRIQHDIKVNLMNPRTEASSKVCKASMIKRAINENALSMNPRVKKGKNAKIVQTPEAVKDDKTEQVKKSMEFEHQIQVQQKRKECHQIAQKSLPAEHKHKGTSSAENLNEQIKDGVLEGIGKNEGKSESISSEVTATPISLLRGVGELSFSSETTRKKVRPKSSPKKLVKLEPDASNSTADEAIGGAKNVHQISPLCIKNKKELKLVDLRAIAKSQKVPRYYKHKKEELQKLLGLD